MKLRNKCVLLAFCLLLFAFGAAAQSSQAPRNAKIVKGTVVDDTGAPLPGVTVQVSETTRGVLTDLDGRYEIRVASSERLTFSFIGMRQKEVPVGDKSYINVEMVVNNTELEEATVVAFGKQKRESVIGAISTVKTENLVVPSSDLTTALAGNIAGVIAFSRSGEPGKENTDFFVRGVATFEGNTNPLILIDNIELTTTDLSRLQPDDIESFSIMKDATATALYGSRAANGVILVTTKRGKEGPAKVFARVESSVARPTHVVELADNNTFMRLANEAILTRNPDSDLMYSQDKIENTGKPGVNPYIYPNNDWYSMLFKDYSISNRATVNVSGGGKVATYFTSVGFTKDEGILNVDKRNSFNSNIDDRNYTVRSNIDVNVTPTTKLGIRMTGNFDDYTGPINGGDSMYNLVVHSNPVLFPAYYDDNSQFSYAQHILFGNYNQGEYNNPYAQMVRGYKDKNRSQMLIVMELDQDLDFITKGLRASFMGNISRLSEYSVTRQYNPFYYGLTTYDSYTGKYGLSALNESSGTEYLGYSESGKNVVNTTYTESKINYNREFGIHGVSGLLVFTTSESLKANQGNLVLSLPSRNVGLAGRFTYDLLSRYFLEFNFGYNGSERFAKKHRWGFFPSAGGAWVISNEEFFKPLKKTISNLKLRYSYGLVGNDNIGSAADRFYYLSNVSFSGAGMQFGEYANNAYSGVTVTQYANDNITWETSYKSNAAVELGLFGKANIIAEYYTEHRTNLLMTRADIPVTMGLTSTMKANIGEAYAHGVDIQSDYQQSWGTDLWTAARFNFTYARSEYKIYEEPEYAESYRSHVGYPIRQAWGYIAKSLFVDDAEAQSSAVQTFGADYGGGDIRYLDVNNDGQITIADRVPIGNPLSPEIIYGFGLSVGYKNFDASVFFQGLANESFFIDAASTSPFQNQTNLLKAYADSHWSEENQDIYATWPRLSYSRNANNTQTSTWWMRDGSFLRLKQAEFGYTIPRKLTRRMHINNFRVYFNGTNLLTFSKFRMWDVELAGQGLNYPIMRVFNLGINVTFE